MNIRKALIGERVELPDGRIGKVTGINDTLVARVSLGNAVYQDVPQDALKHLPTKMEDR